MTWDTPLKETAIKFVLKNEDPMVQRYQLQFPGVLLNEFLPDSKDSFRLFAEEYDYVRLICREQMISMADFSRG